MISRPTSEDLKSPATALQAGAASEDAAEPHLIPVPHGGGRSLVRSTTCMTPLEPVPYAKYTRSSVAPVPAIGLGLLPARGMEGPVEMGPWMLGTAVKCGGIALPGPGSCPSSAQSRRNTGLAGLLRSKMKMWLPGLHPSAVSLPRLPTMYAIPESHSHQLLCVPASAPGAPMSAPMTGLPPATVRTPTGWLGFVTSQISCAAFA